MNSESQEKKPVDAYEAPELIEFGTFEDWTEGPTMWGVFMDALNEGWHC